MAKLKFGVWLPTYAWEKARSGNMQRISESIRLCEQYGFDIWVIDHLLTAPGLYGVSWLEPLNVLAYAAALTQRVKLATGILVLPVRHPVMLAKEIATLCHISQGRFMLGAGPGWNQAEFEATGSHISERGRRTDEIIEALRLLLTRPDVTYEGRYYQFRNVTIEPRPAVMPELWVAGGSKLSDAADHDQASLAPSVLRRIVRAGNWLSRCAGTQEWVKRDWNMIKRYARENGAAAVRFGHCNFVHLVNTNDQQRALEESRQPFLRVMGTHRPFEHLCESYLIGTIDHINARIADLVDAGLEYLVLGPVTDDPGQIEMMAKRVAYPFA
jgi:probable F420-dependent oxidoreductase